MSSTIEQPETTSRPSRYGSALLFALMVSAVVLVMSWALSEELVYQESVTLDQAMDEELKKLSNTIISDFQYQITALERMAQRWEVAGGTPRPQWDSDAKHYVEDFAALTTVEWVDKTYHVRWIEPLLGNEEAMGLNIAFNEERKKALAGAAEKQVITITPPLDLVQGYRAVISYLPLHVNDSFDGFIVGIYNTDKFSDEFLPKVILNRLHFSLHDGEKLIFQNHGAPIMDLPHARQTMMPLLNRSWTLRISPKDVLISEHRTVLPKLTLIIGAVLSLLMGFASYSAIKSNRQSRVLRRQTDALEESEQRISAILETAPDGIISCDKEGMITSANDAMQILFGYDRDELIGKPVTTLIPDRFHTHHDDYVSDYVDRGAAKIMSPGREVYGRHKDGHEFPLEIGLSKARLTDGTVRAVATIRDITEKKKTYLQQQREQNILEQIYLSSSESSLGFDERMQRILEAGCEYYGLTLGIISHIEGDNYSVMHVSENDELESGHRFKLGDTYCAFTYGKDDSTAYHHVRHSEISKHPCYQNLKLESYIGTTIHANGQAYGTLNFTSSEPRTEPFSEREKSFLKLMAQWVGFEIARNQLIEQLTDSNEELERFAYVCSHDLQEPLRMISSFSEKLEEHLLESLADDEKGKKYFHFVTDGAKRAQALIKDILVYASVDREMKAPETFEMSEIVDVARDNLAASLEQSSGEITTDKLPSIHAHKTQIYQLVQNLINNGLKYQKPDAKPSVHVGVEDTSSHWQFSVKDNGIGMEPQHLAKIFDVFQRLHRKEEYSGTGVGLSICKKIVERHGGEIWVESEPGKGSVFHFTIAKTG
ncbi:MAG: ATP-binding protein [Rickettsiales bacterium]|nr:ATP-binding protein [Rickettsiales bacterium]